MVSPDLLCRSAFLIAAAGHDDGQSEQLAEHDRHCTDPAGATVDQHLFAFAGKAAVEQIAPHREQRLRQRRRLGHGQAVRNVQTLADGRHTIFGIATAIGQCADPAADPFRSDVLAQRNHRARYFEPGQRRCARRGRIKSHALDHVRPVDPGSGHADQHLPGARLRNLHGHGLQYFRSARFADRDGSHFFLQYVRYGH